MSNPEQTDNTDLQTDHLTSDPDDRADAWAAVALIVLATLAGVVFVYGAGL